MFVYGAEQVQDCFFAWQYGSDGAGLFRGLQLLIKVLVDDVRASRFSCVAPMSSRIRQR